VFRGGRFTSVLLPDRGPLRYRASLAKLGGWLGLA
jgi:hypothetical protein